jgi:putative transposase
MARPLRIEYPGAIYHVMSRGNARQAIVRDDVDRQKLLKDLEDTVVRCGWEMFPFAFMLSASSRSQAENLDLESADNVRYFP